MLMQGSHVTEMYFVASAWAGARLTDLKQPHILIKDSEDDMTLCEYHLEVCSTEHAVQPLPLLFGCKSG